LARALRLHRDSFPDDPALDTAVSHAILDRVAAGELPETARIGRPGAMVAFGRQDVASRLYSTAVRAARGGGFEAVERLAGGRAAVFHEGTLAFAHASADEEPQAGIYTRFEATAELMTAALRRLGVDARMGEVPGEYCPGGYSVNAGGRTKLAGLGQKLIKGAAHLGGVLVVRDSERVRRVLVPVYQALGLEWDPATAGSVEDETGEASLDALEAALLEELSARYELEESPLDGETLALARRLAPQHRSPG
jgi:octanoyl-[GcvH]:protein N-octanoyltransferase